MSNSKARGFTLIELVVVIVILGILAAFAVPKFMGLEVEARAAAVKSMGGTLSSAAAMAHGVCMARGCTDAAQNIQINGQNVAFLWQYPTNAGMNLLVDSSAGFQYVATNPNGQFRKIGSRTPANCYVQYTPPTASNGVPTILYHTGTAYASNTAAAIDLDLRTQC